MVVRMRANRAHRDNRRSHFALKNLAVTKCSSCSATILRHKMCTNCGNYAGRNVIDFAAKDAKKAKKTKEAETAR